MLVIKAFRSGGHLFLDEDIVFSLMKVRGVENTQVSCDDELLSTYIKI